MPLSYRGSRSLPLHPDSQFACSPKVALLRLLPATICPGRTRPGLGGGRGGARKVALLGWAPTHATPRLRDQGLSFPARARLCSLTTPTPHLRHSCLVFQEDYLRC